MKKSALLLTGALLTALVLVSGFFFLRDNIGVSAEKLETNARASQRISEDWLSAADVSDSAAAMLFYPEDGSRCTFSIYTKRSGYYFGYFFQAGGSLFSIEDGIACFTREGLAEQLFLSMNKPRAARLEIRDGASSRTIELDSGKPFTLVLPRNAGILTFYDRNGKVVEPIPQAL